MAVREIPRFGETADPEAEWEDVDPFPFVLVGYDAKTREPIDFPFLAIGRLSLGAQWDAFSAIGANGKVDNSKVAEFLTKNIVPEQRGKFFETISDDGVLFHIDAMLELAEYLREIREEQMGRPTSPSSESPRGRRPAGRTSGAGSSARASSRTASR